MSERTILVLGASGLIGRFLTDDLRERGFRVVGMARSLSPAQRMCALDLEQPILSL
ncbi:NAD-dependent epimerase/dehydratase family protein, partial [Herbaspirillum sp. HC18]